MISHNGLCYEASSSAPVLYYSYQTMCFFLSASFRLVASQSQCEIAISTLVCQWFYSKWDYNSKKWISCSINYMCVTTQTQVFICCGYLWSKGCILAEAFVVQSKMNKLPNMSPLIQSCFPVLKPQTKKMEETPYHYPTMINNKKNNKKKKQKKTKLLSSAWVGNQFCVVSIIHL